MKPAYDDKDLILVDTSDTNFKNGIWMFIEDDRLFIKRLKKKRKAMTAINDNNLWDSFEVSSDIQLIAKVIGNITSHTNH